MFDHIQLLTHASTYPGGYEPLPARRKLMFEILDSENNKLPDPPILVIQQPTQYTLEIVAPGFNRQDLYIQAINHHLTIAGIITHAAIDHVDINVKSILKDACFIREIDFPGDADLNFVSAEYKEGILYLHVYRSYEVGDISPAEIIVY